MALPALTVYSVGAGQPIHGGRWAGGRLTGAVDLGAVLVAGSAGTVPSSLSGDLGLTAATPSGVFLGVPTIEDDNLLAFDEGVATSGWTITSGTGTLSQSGSAVRLTSTAAAVQASLPLAGPSANDAIILIKGGTKYTAGQYSTLQLMDGASAVLQLSFGYDHVAANAALGTVSAFDAATSSGNVIASSTNYESVAQEVCIHVDRNFSAVNLWVRESTGKWDFRGSFPYAAGYASLDSVALLTSAHAGQWIEYDWIGYARPNMVSIGDSICAGANSFNPNPAHYAGEDNANSTWQKHAQLYQTLRNTLIVNKGIGGQSSAQTLARIAEATAHGARVVFLHASSNDYGAGASQATRSANIQACVDAIAAASAQTVLLNALYGTSAHSQNTAGALRDYGQLWWSTYRPALTGVAAVVDIMQPLLGGAGYEDAAKCVDTIHPSAASYEAIGAYITAAL